MTGWSVTIELAGTDGPPTAEELSAFTTALAPLSGVVTGSPERPSDGRNRYGAAVTVKAADAVDAVQAAANAIRGAAKAAGLPAWVIVSAEAIEEDELDRSLSKAAFPALLGVREIANLLGVTPQRASALARSAAFPKPVAGLASGPVWTEPSVRLFVAEWQRRPGPRKQTA
jgi:hypothetical protein